MTWAIERRLDYIAWRLASRGTIRRSDLVRVFDISEAHASSDLTEFNRAHPGAMAYNLSAKHYAANGVRDARALLPGIDWAAIDGAPQVQGGIE